jgi:outer membrane protein TolC
MDYLKYFNQGLKLLICLAFCQAYTLMVSAQQPTEPKTLTEKDYISIVRKFHPVVKQADILLERAAAELTIARGGFDPLLYNNNEEKVFGNTLYYRYTNSELKVPTWYGIEVKAGIENVNGSFSDPQETLGKTSYLGISIPLAKNLLMDKRRATLQQARLLGKQSKADRTLLINDLLNESLITYWDWVREYQIQQVIANAVKVNETRYGLVKIEFEQGNRAAMDTMEALAQLQSFRAMLNDATLRFINAGVELSNYLWQDGQTPYLLPSTVTPDTLWWNETSALKIPTLDSLLQAARIAHPKLQSIGFKLDALDIERKLKFQSLLPVVNFNGNLLNKGYNVTKGADLNFLQNNYKFGFNIYIPLRFSEGRGEYRKTKLKIRETSLDQSMLYLQIDNKIKTYYNEWQNLVKQISINEDMYNNYRALLTGEELRITLGESTLFILNARENKALESLQKLMELRAKLFKTYAGVQWAAGLLR